MIAAAEESGGLDQMLLRVSEYLEKEFALREMIKRETFKPKMELAASIFLPPLYIIFVQGWNAYVHQVIDPAMMWSAVAIAAFCAVRVSFRSKEVRQAYDTIKAFIPWFGGTVRMLALAEFSRERLRRCMRPGFNTASAYHFSASNRQYLFYKQDR